MNAHLRVEAALAGRETDRVPWTPLLGGAARRIYGATYSDWSQDGEIAALSFKQAYDLLDFDVLPVLIDLNVEAADFGVNVTYPVDEPSDPNFSRPLVGHPDEYFTKVRAFDPDRGKRMSEYRRTCELVVDMVGSRVPVLGFAYGPLGVLSIMRGPERLMDDCLRRPDAVDHALGVITDVLVDYLGLLARTGIHGLWVETLFCARVMMNRNLWQKTEGAYIRKMAEAARKHGLPIWAHSPGVGYYLDAHLEALDPVVMSSAWTPDGCETWTEAKKTWGGRVTLMGYLTPPRHIYLGSPDSVREECRRLINEMAPGGGFILAPGWEFPPNASILNALAMKEAVEIYSTG